MSTITILGNARRGCSGLTRRETLKVGALTLLGGLCHLLGIDPAMPVFDRANRPIAVAHGGEPIMEILA